MAVPGRPYNLLAVSQVPQEGDASLVIREEAESGPAPLPAWKVTGVEGVAWGGHGTGYDAFLANHELLIILPATAPP